LGGQAGNTIYDAASGCVLVAVQTLNQIVAIDPSSNSVVGRYGLGGATANPHGMYVDGARRLLFVANQSSAQLLEVDLRTMQVTDRQTVGANPDVLAFDYAWQRLYVASESGVVSVFTEQGTKLVHNGDITLPNAHTVAVDPRTHLVYLPLENVNGSPLIRILSAAAPGP
jgi:DNA-binding beta-propeller fold protein YncE